ncbi:hypothetical protein GCM10027275_08670 [Rhabdobacter roseus]|uniref:Uncharacterized protein n=1 Tax=Rhabdobacter roseus TaxID=1655419 RepID=A0A840TLW5_9BACT|nr:hypothetical protein [Rhabdobacter roseus]MBB5282767.1 hypothetical protein [Rhabdobacter roseus]
MKNQTQTAPFIWRVAAAHTIAYFIAGLFAVTFLNYKEHYASEFLSGFMRQVDDPLVALGPALQVIRGIIIALVLLPFRHVFLSERHGMLKLAWLLLGLSYISTIGPSPGSFEGYIYTILPVQYHLLGIPETLLYIALLVFILQLWYAFDKRWFLPASIFLVVLIMLMSTMGYLQATGGLG